MDPKLKEVLKHQGEIIEKENEGRIEILEKRFPKLGEYLGKPIDYSPHSGLAKIFYENGYIEFGFASPEDQYSPEHREMRIVLYEEEGSSSS